MILDNKKIRHIHCIGIGGIGVSGIAEILLKKNYEVSGSDSVSSANTKRLINLGAKVHLSHAENYVNNADAVIYSSAISDENPELAAAKHRGIPLVRRGEMLAELMAQKQGIAIAGTHGKTTTTGIVAHTLLSANVDTTYVIGGVMNNSQSPAHMGEGEYFVAEADESDASFLYLKPKMAIVTNIDDDHLGTYQGDFNILKKTFLSFLNAIPVEGLAVLCIDDPNVKELVSGVRCRVITYGQDLEADIRLTDFQQQGLVSRFTVVVARESRSVQVSLNMAGIHNGVNALAAIAIAEELAIPSSEWLKALVTFPGMGRRFQAHGEIKANNGTALLFDDYGHHPCELKATMAAARAAWPTRRLVWVFQPHRYSRTQELMKEFAKVLIEADLLVLLEIYSAGEKPLPGVNGEALCRAIMSMGRQAPIFVPHVNQVASVLREHLQDGDIVLLQGAGTIGVMAADIASELSV